MQGSECLSQRTPGLLWGEKMSRSTWWDSLLVGVGVGLCVLRPVYHPLT